MKTLIVFSSGVDADNWLKRCSYTHNVIYSQTSRIIGNIQLLVIQKETHYDSMRGLEFNLIIEDEQFKPPPNWHEFKLSRLRV